MSCVSHIVIVMDKTLDSVCDICYSGYDLRNSEQTRRTMKLARNAHLAVLMSAVLLSRSLPAPAAVTSEEAASLIGGCRGCNNSTPTGCPQSEGVNHPCVSEYRKGTGKGIYKWDVREAKCVDAANCDVIYDRDFTKEELPGPHS